MAGGAHAGPRAPRRLAVERAPAGTQLYGAAEDDNTTRQIAEKVADHLGIDASSIATDQVTEHFQGFAFIMGLDFPPMSDPQTRELLEWTPTHPGLMADLDDGHYFA